MKKIVISLLVFSYCLYSLAQENNNKLIKAAEKGNLEKVIILINEGANINSINKYGTPLHRASSGGYLEIVKFLVEKGANINMKTLYGEKTPLHEACDFYFFWVNLEINFSDTSMITRIKGKEKNYLDIVKYLIENGADIRAKDNKGEMPIDNILILDAPELLSLLKEKGVDIDQLKRHLIKIETFTDSRDGKIYKSVVIGSQTWMAENLAYKTTNGCFAYNNDTSIVKSYGYLYKWITAKNACPDGWHLPTDTEWEILINQIGGKNAGGRLKSTIVWNSPNTGATNSSGFSALPGGSIFPNGTSNAIGGIGYWWSATEMESDISNAIYRFLDNDKTLIDRAAWTKEDCYSVRCVKD